MFERSNAYSNILFVRSVVSFVLQIAFAKWRNSRAKINALRAQLGREMAIELNKKSGQATDEKYVSKWMFYEQLKFLRPVMATIKIRDSISTQNNGLNDSVSFPENEAPLKKRL